MDTSAPTPKTAIIKNIYFYLVSFVALMMVTFSVADLVNMALKTWVFTKADYYSYYTNPSCDLSIQKADPEIKPMTPENCAILQEQNKKQEAENRISDRQRNAVRDISFIVVGVPLFLLHWRTIRRKEDGK
jgi:hypothetical protein